MIGIIPNENLSIQDLKLLRKISSLSIADIRKAAINRAPIKTFEAFVGAWETDRTVLAKLAKIYTENQYLPYQFISMENSEIDEILTPKMLRIKLNQLRQIELETQKNSDLENGYIKNPDEFEPGDEDWTIID